MIECILDLIDCLWLACLQLFLLWKAAKIYCALLQLWQMQPLMQTTLQLLWKMPFSMSLKAPSQSIKTESAAELPILRYTVLFANQVSLIALLSLVLESTDYWECARQDWLYYASTISVYLPLPRRICFCRCLFVSNFAPKHPNGFAWNFQRRLAMGQWTID